MNKISPFRKHGLLLPSVIVNHRVTVLVEQLKDSSPKRVFKDPINLVQKRFDFCIENLNNIDFRLLLHQNIQNERKHLQDRFSKAKIILGTRGFLQSLVKRL